MRILLAIIAIVIFHTASVSLAIAGTATWTGKQIPIPASTGYTAKCEYTEGLIKFWRLTNAPCEQNVKTTNGGEIPKTGTTKGKSKSTMANTPLY